ncbi:MAG: hypothetical protein P8L84_02295 [Methylococcaceae bacterium]|nr:hypothetical protein [Methylococcaceae bacterium]
MGVSVNILSSGNLHFRSTEWVAQMQKVLVLSFQIDGIECLRDILKIPERILPIQANAQSALILLVLQRNDRCQPWRANARTGSPVPSKHR